MRAVGFWSEEGGYVDNVLGADADGQPATNADVAEDDQNIYRTTGGRLSGLWTINEDWNLLTTGIYQRGDTMGTWETDPFLGDNKVTRFYDEWRDDEWWTAAATLKGNLGFAELSLTGSYFDRRIDYQWDNTNYAQWRSFYYSIGLLPRVLRPLRHGSAALDDLQLAEAGTLGLRGPADLAGRQQAAVDGGRVLRGRLRLVGVRRPGAGTGRHAGVGQRPTRTAWNIVDTTPGADLPAGADRHLVLQPVRQHGQAARLLRRDDLRPDRQVVGHGRRALVRVRPRHVRLVPGAASACRRKATPMRTA